MTSLKAASPELSQLEPFVGAWDTQGAMYTEAPEHTQEFSAKDTYEWVAAGNFLLHKFDAAMPSGMMSGVELIGYARSSKSYPMYSFDSSGTVTLMQARLDEGIWTFEGEAIRFRGGFSDGDRVFGGLWEVSAANGSEWKPLMRVRLAKRDIAQPGVVADGSRLQMGYRSKGRSKGTLQGAGKLARG